jgi:hypothetical protein
MVVAASDVSARCVLAAPRTAPRRVAPVQHYQNAAQQRLQSQLLFCRARGKRIKSGPEQLWLLQQHHLLHRSICQRI